ncbi:MAG: choline-sulfatase [Rhodospirillaceae bacterium]|nr:choline-sulfatase [Rhodospirillaceae bacterium]MDD9916001.1 choline-sulfatase [Rhodospirillaceae bacterium]MDD9929706.1 choline-sulfatase [Rhodospirillaceae bacterium]
MAATKDAPNILVIQLDQMTPGALPPYGHPLVKAPHIAGLADEGVVFENAYCNFPLCVPSRMSMLAGRHTSAIGQWDNAIELPASVPTLAHYLRTAGYHTVLCGKMHFIGPDQVHGFNERITTDIYPANFAWTPDWIVGERYRPTGINPRAVVEAGVCARSLQIDYDDEVEHAGIQKIYDLARFNKESPFLLWVSFTHPHSPFVTTQKYWDLYDHDAIDMPKVGPIPVEEQDAMSRMLHYGHAQDLLTITDDHVRNARHAYYGMTSYMDDKVGRILATLEEMDLAENTVVVLTADHGEMLGERGGWFKQYFYEPSTGVPLIVRAPGRYRPGRASELVSLVDLLPTFMDIATNGDAPEPASPLDGNSLTGLLNGGDSGWDNKVISEYTGEGVSAPCRMIRRDNYKYIYTHGHPPLLYDLDRDPLEIDNLAGRPETAEIEARLAAEIMQDYDPEAVNEACIQSQKERLFIQKATDGIPSWAYIARAGDDARYVRNASAVGAKAAARYPFVEPTPFER